MLTEPMKKQWDFLQICERRVEKASQEENKMRCQKILTRAQYLKEYFKALMKDDYMELDILKKAHIFSKYFIFMRCEKCSVLPVVITEKDVKSKLAYSGYALYLYAKCPNCGKSLLLDENDVADKCAYAYKYFHKKAYKEEKSWGI